MGIYDDILNLVKLHKKILGENFYNLLLLVLILLTLPLFFFKLGQTSLISWDEAWYAEITRNIVKRGDFINLWWNGNPFIDHPPTGYWLMALTFKILGVSEFWVRFPSAISGILSIILVYLLGKKLFNPLVGLSSATALSSAIWFIFRARSGNLDIILTMFFLLTILLALYSLENKKYLIPLAISLSLLFLTKTMVPLAIIPSLIIIFYKNKLFKLKDLILPSIIFAIIALGWFIIQIAQNNNFFDVYFGIGLRGVSLESSYISNLSLAKEYLHSGIGRWFWPSILSLIFSFIFLQKRFLIFSSFFISFMIPIIFSPKIQIWHLIPLFPFLLLLYFGFSYTFLEKFLGRFKYPIFGLVLIFSSYIYLNQIKMIWYQFIDIPAFVSDEAILSKEASKYPYDLYIDGDFIPAALFYSEKGILEKAPIYDDEFISLLKSDKDLLVITNVWRIDKLKISEDDYKLLKKDRDKVLILHTKE